MAAPVEPAPAATGCRTLPDMVARPFGAVLTAMVTPLNSEGSVDLAAAEKLAVRLVAEGNDGLVVSGTTGEAPTTSDTEKRELLAVVRAAVGPRVPLVAGVGTNDTAHSVALATEAARAGADGLLVVAPYYSKPTQAGIAAHLTSVANATELPIMIYDIPGRTGVAVATETLVRLAEHRRIVAVKDAKGDLAAATRVMRRCNLAYYSGDDALTLAHLTNGAVGLVGVTSHLLAGCYATMVAAVERGDLTTALTCHRDSIDLVDAVMTRLPGAVAAKAALELLGAIPTRLVRSPLLPASDEETAELRAALVTAGLLG